MTQSPRPPKQPGRTTKQHSVSSPMTIILLTALDTTWRAFVPTVGGVFVGIGFDYLFGIAPIATIVCLLAGTALSIFLIAVQLRNVRKQRT